MHTKSKEKEEIVWVQRKGEEMRFARKRPLTATEIPRLPVCVVRGATGAVAENVLPSRAHFEKNRIRCARKEWKMSGG
jgi:hypothetical protein